MHIDCGNAAVVISRVIIHALVRVEAGGIYRYLIFPLRDLAAAALEELKNNGVGMILFAGDIGDEGSYFAFKTYQSVIDEVFGEDKPVIQTIMGNHDYWSESALSANTTKTNPSGRYAAGFGRSQNKILEFNEKQALSDIWQCLLLLYLFDFFRLDTAKKLNLDNNRKFLYNKIRSGIRKIRL